MRARSATRHGGESFQDWCATAVLLAVAASISGKGKSLSPPPVAAREQAPQAPAAPEPAREGPRSRHSAMLAAVKPEDEATPAPPASDVHTVLIAEDDAV